jgi:aldose 1-epimerase
VTHILENRRVRAVVDPQRGARLDSLAVDGHELLADGGCFPMVPWAGRIRDGKLRHDGRVTQLPLSKDGNAIHGLGRTLPWVHLGNGTFSRTLGAPWPTEGTAELRYIVLDDGLRIELSWDDGTTQPCSLGLHPWFRRRLTTGADVELRLDPEVMVERGPDALPTGRLLDPRTGPWDDCFRLVSPPVLHWPGAVTLILSSSSPWWVVYDEPAGTVCVEPQTVPPDAFDHPALQPAGPWPRQIWFELRATPRVGDGPNARPDTPPARMSDGGEYSSAATSSSR